MNINIIMEICCINVAFKKVELALFSSDPLDNCTLHNTKYRSEKIGQKREPRKREKRGQTPNLTISEFYGLYS